MAKDKTAYVCSNCGQESTKWIGKCPSCGQWNTFREIRIAANTGQQAARHAAGMFRENRHDGLLKGNTTHKAQKLGDISVNDEPRLDMHDNELNRVLGGGLVKGSIVLLGGEPGIGKSTLTLQTVLALQDTDILYVSGEESAQQLKSRADRLSQHQKDNSDSERLSVLCENSLENIFACIAETKPQLVVIDSIQTISTEDVDSSPGSLTQVRECAASLLRFAKSSGVPVILIGHITKDGAIAGPKILEHIVDTVIQFEGDQHYSYRILRSIKNRFGSTSELGIYEMTQKGLREVSNPSELLLTQDHEGMSGIAICCHRRGTPVSRRDTGSRLNSSIRHTATLYNRIRPAETQYAARRAREESRIPTHTERCIHKHRRRTAGDGYGNRHLCHRICHLEQHRHSHRKRMVYVRRGRTVR